jgi:hypothetical protein
MAYLFLNLYGQRERGHLDPDEAIVRLQEAFPEAIVRPGDQLFLRTRQAEQHLDPADAAQCVVVARLQDEARTLGPA